MLIASVRCKTQANEEKHGSRGWKGAGEGFVDLDPKRANVTRRGWTTMQKKGATVREKGVKTPREKKYRPKRRKECSMT